MLGIIDFAVIPDSLKTASLFKGHLLAPVNPEYKFHYTQYDYLSSSILFISFLLFVLLYATNYKRLNIVIKGFYSNRYANQMSRDEFSIGSGVTVFLSLLFILSLSLFITQSFQYYGLGKLHFNFVKIFLFSALGISGVYFIKHITVSIAGRVFQVPKAASDFRMTIFLFCNSLGLFMFPIVICLSFAKQFSPPVFIYSGLFLIAIFILTRTIRGFIIWTKAARASVLYLFLYLCALEILPWLVFLKLFFIQIN